MEHLRRKTAIITGASRGIGEATARYLAEQGANVVLAARSGKVIDELAVDINSADGAATSLACDVSKASDVSALIDHARQAFGSVDILINNAGIIDPIARIADTDPDAWSQVVDVNLKGVYYAMRSVIPVMQANGAGTIINISSGAANSFMEGWSHYCATKAAVQRLTGIAHKEYAADGVRVVGLSPGTVATEMQVKIKASGINPVSQLDPSVHIPPEWVAQAIGFLCGPEGDEFAGEDFSLKTDEGRKRAGLPTV